VLEFVIEAMVDAVVVIDADGRITLANSGAAALTQFSREELRAMHVGRLLEDDSSGLRTVVRRRIEDGSVLRRQESWLLTRDGDRVPVSVTGSPVVDDAGALQGIVLVARDIRETQQLLAEKEAEIERRRIAEDELRGAKASIEEKLEQVRTQLLLAERRATLGTLAGGVGHELRNIAQIQVAAVDEIADALRSHGDLDERVRQYLPELERVGDHITQHGERLMQLARPGPDHVEPIELASIIRDVAAMLKLAGKLAHVELALSLPGEVLTCPVNRTRVRTIPVYLVINSVDATDGTGKTAIAVRRSADGRRAVCSIHDNGPGIPDDVMKKVFEPFFTTKGDAGTGLGLPVVREIVMSYGGSVTVTSDAGSGTTFTFDLPC